MAQRFRLPSAGAAAISPAVRGTWTHQPASIPYYRMPSTQVGDSSALATVEYAPDASDHLVNGSALHAIFVSDPMQAGQTFPQIMSFKWAIQGLEAHANNNLVNCIHIYICSQDGSTVRATMAAQATAQSALEFGTSLQNRYRLRSPSWGAAYVTQAGDRLVLEFGLINPTGQSPAAAGGVQGHNGSLRFGSAGAGGDLPENDTEAGTTFNPWFEVSNPATITFVQAGANVDPSSAAPSTAQVFAPTVVAAQAIQQSARADAAPAVFAPGIAQNILPGFIAATASVATPSIIQAIVLQLSSRADAAPAVFAPVVEPGIGGGININVSARADAAPSVFPPVVAPAVTMTVDGRAQASPAVFAPVVQSPALLAPTTRADAATVVLAPVIQAGQVILLTERAQAAAMVFAPWVIATAPPSPFIYFECMSGPRYSFTSMSAPRYQFKSRSAPRYDFRGGA